MQFTLKVVQFSVAVAVIGSNIKYGWTPNGYVAGLVALFAVLLATAIIMESLRLYRWSRAALKRLNEEKITRRSIGR
jgi:hypothetical protein